jgi:hypothetical protein
MALSKTAFQLLIASALLLGLAAFKLALSRKRRVSVKPSAVIEELAIHMGRITNALANLADPLGDRSHFTRFEGANTSRPAGKDDARPTRASYWIFERFPCLLIPPDSPETPILPARKAPF